MEPETLPEAMALWRAGAITNWEYLMKLNGLAGRTYNDLMQYPVRSTPLLPFRENRLLVHFLYPLCKLEKVVWFLFRQNSLLIDV